MINTLNHSTKIATLLSIATLLIGAAFLFVDPIPQDLEYHQFADQQTFFGIPHFFNVVSNLPFIIIGIYGLLKIISHFRTPNNDAPLSAYYIFFIGITLTGFGSGYYHLSPDNQTLVWDRIPMTIAFMALFSFFISEHINKRSGAKLLWPLITLGIFSVIYWIYTENQDAGDLRLYALIQFLPMLLIPLIIYLFPSKTYQLKYLGYIIGVYILAKITEHFDEEIMDVLIISGHTWKHILAALSGIAFLKLVLSKSVNTN